MTQSIRETKQCTHCGATFAITKEDIEFYDKVSPIYGGIKYPVPTPNVCPDCRQQRRLAFRNERKLYKRTCDATGKQIISIYSEDKPYKVYDPKIWRSDQWNPMESGQEYDFTTPFFQQIKELTHKVPVIALNVMGNENCDYVNCCGYSKNCYLSYNTDYSQDMLYCSNCIKSKDGVDLYKCSQSTSCFDSVDLYNCYHLLYSQFCFDCTNSWYIVNCKGCSDCYGCINLTNQQYCIFNTPYTKEEYEKHVEELKKQPIDQQRQTAQKFFLTQPYMYIKGNNNELCTGNYLFNDKNVQSGFDVGDSQNCKYCGILNEAYDCHDWDHTGYGGNLCYQLSSCGDNIHKTIFSVNSWSGAENVLYCILNINIKDCFGCVGLRNKQYCILNKQYTKEEYEQLVPKIIEHMQQNGEWGEFFPANISPFGYNETIAQEYFPLTKEETLQQGYKRSDYEMPFPYVDKMLNANDLPNITEVSDDILQQAILCEVTGKPFRIVKPELEFYRKYNLPLPHKHPDQRHIERMQLRNPRKLFERTCDQCGTVLQTSYAPERPEIVYCEECYNKAIYG